MDFNHTAGGQQAAASHQQIQPPIDGLHQINQYQLNQAGLHQTSLYFPQPNPAPPNATQAVPPLGRQLHELERYLSPALVQKSQLESMIAAVDFTAMLASFPEAWEQIIECKARIAFDLLKLSTVIKDRLQNLELGQADSKALRRQLIMDLDRTWEKNIKLVRDLVVAARRINPQSALAVQIDAALLESGTHQAMINV